MSTTDSARTRRLIWWATMLAGLGPASIVAMNRSCPGTSTKARVRVAPSASVRVVQA